MSSLGRIKATGNNTVRRVYASLPFPGVRRPVFIIGCGRSGTTILGTSLAQFGEVTYLNEPRKLWASAYPCTDIWSPEALARKGKLVLTGADAERGKSNRLSRLFRFETLRSGRPILVEKLPINCFRLDWILHSFPDARFVHIYRNGLEVASSIARRSERGGWFGTASYKWDLLAEHAQRSRERESLPAQCSSYFDKGLLEWRLSTEAAVTFLSCLSDDAFIEVSYDDFTDDPVRTISQIIEFIGIESDLAVATFVTDRVARRSSRLIQNPFSPKTQLLGGKLLPLSMDGGKGLTERSTALLVRNSRGMRSFPV